MEKVRPWCGQPSDRGQLKNRTDLPPQNSSPCNSFYCLSHSKYVYDDDDDVTTDRELCDTPAAAVVTEQSATLSTASEEAVATTGGSTEMPLVSLDLVHFKQMCQLLGYKSKSPLVLAVQCLQLNVVGLPPVRVSKLLTAADSQLLHLACAR